MAGATGFFNLTLAPSTEEQATIDGRFLSCLAATAPFEVIVNDASKLFMAEGISYLAGDGEVYRRLRIVNTSGAENIIRLAFGPGELRDQRLTASGNLNVQQVAGEVFEVQPPGGGAMPVTSPAPLDVSAATVPVAQVAPLDVSAANVPVVQPVGEVFEVQPPGGGAMPVSSPAPLDVSAANVPVVQPVGEVFEVQPPGGGAMSVTQADEFAPKEEVAGFFGSPNDVVLPAGQTFTVIVGAVAQRRSVVVSNVGVEAVFIRGNVGPAATGVRVAPGEVREFVTNQQVVGSNPSAVAVTVRLATFGWA